MNIFKSKNREMIYKVNRDFRKDFSIQVQNGEVTISSPWTLSNTDINRIVEEKKIWIMNKLEQYEKRVENQKYIKSEKVMIFNKQFELKVSYKNIQVSELNLEDEDIKVVLPKKYKKIGNRQILDLLIEKMYIEIAKKEVEQVMEKTRITMGFAPEDYDICIMKDTLAKCIDQEKILINPYIAVYSKDVLNYVVVSQFCKLKFQRRTKGFYNLLEKYIPDYKRYEKYEF